MPLTDRRVFRVFFLPSSKVKPAPLSHGPLAGLTTGMAAAVCSDCAKALVRAQVPRLRQIASSVQRKVDSVWCIASL